METWAEGRVTANGIEIAYRRTGGERPPVLLLHGLTDNGACWTHLARALERDYDLIMPDARGHGRSTAPASGYSDADRAADALALIAALGLERPALIGHSMGGLTAAVLAAEAPSQIRGAILEDPAFLMPEVWDTPDVRGWAAHHEDSLSISEAEMIGRGRAEHPTWAADLLTIWARSKFETRVQAFAWFDNPPPDFRALVARIGVPTLLVTGDAPLGAIVTASVADELRASNPQVRVAHIPGAGHCIRHDMLAPFVVAVQAFLAELV